MVLFFIIFSLALRKLTNVLLEPIHNFNGSQDALKYQDALKMKRKLQDMRMRTQKFDLNFQVKAHRILNLIGK